MTTRHVVFKPFGPYRLVDPVLRFAGTTREVVGKELRRWLSTEPMGTNRGVYIFALRTGRGTKPWYVGKTWGSFAGECSQPHKLLKYQRAMALSKGTPLLYLLVDPSKKKANRRAIKMLEEELIAWAYERNPRLVNDQGKEPAIRVGVQGVFEGKQGKPSPAARGVRKTLGIK